MISTFVSHKFGFGMLLSDEDMKKVNECRCHKHYSDRLVAAVEKRGTSMKQPLKGSPILSEFDYRVTGCTGVLDI
jgi:hypothetical protein